MDVWISSPAVDGALHWRNRKAEAGSSSSNNHGVKITAWNCRGLPLDCIAYLILNIY